MRPVKYAEFKKRYLLKRFWKKIKIICPKWDTCEPLKSAFYMTGSWGFGFHHYLKDDAGNHRDYPDVIECLFFLDYLPNCCHTNCFIYPLKHITTHQAAVRQETLNKPKWEKVKAFVNGRSL